MAQRLNISERIKYCTPGSFLHDDAYELANASPDLLAACEDSLGYFRAILEISAFVGEQAAVQAKIDKLEAAIAKAQGERGSEVHAQQTNPA